MFQKVPDRNRRDRPPHPQGLQGAGHIRRSPYIRKFQRHACAPRRRKRLLGRPARDSPRYPVNPRGVRDHWRRCRASRLRLSQRERAFRAHSHRAKITFIGPSSHHIEIMVTKITAQEDLRRLGIRWSPAPPARLQPRTRPSVSRPRSVTNPHQGNGGRWRQGHEGRARSESGDRLVGYRAEAGRISAMPPSTWKNTFDEERAIEVAAHRRRPGQRRASRHPRLFLAAPTPEGLGRSLGPHGAAQQMQIGEICAAAMRKLKYSGAGTIEFLYENERVLFHRDEHRDTGGAPGYRAHHRRRHRL